jgi:hypothetical protein
VSLFEEAQCGGALGRDPLLGTPKDILSKALAWAPVYIGPLILGNMEGLQRAFEIKRYRVYQNDWSSFNLPTWF